MKLDENPLELFFTKNNEIAIVCDEQIITYYDLYEKVNIVANQFKKNGVKENDHVAIYMDNSIEFIVSFFAIHLCGAVIIPIYSKYPNAYLVQVINNLDIDLIISNNKYHNEMLSIAKNKVGVFLLNDISLEILRNKEAFPINKAWEIRPFIILSTSGTTSLPKAIMLSINNVLSNIDSISSYLQLVNEDKILLVKNIVHSSTIVGEMMVGLRNGCALILTQKVVTPNLIFSLVKQYNISIFFAVPFLLQMLIRNSEIVLQSIRIINFYGGKIDLSTLNKVKNIFPNALLIYSYGLTEAAPRVTYILEDELFSKNISSGKAIKNVELCIVNEKNDVLKENEIGEILVKGPNVMLGYYKNIEKTKTTLVDNYLHTGDMGYLDEEGFLFVTGRKDNMFEIAGKNIYPEEIESVLMNIDGIIDALVVCQKGGKANKILEAFIVCNKDLKIDNIRSFCRKNLPDYKVPRKISFVREVPKTSTGKTIRYGGNSCDKSNFGKNN